MAQARTSRRGLLTWRPPADPSPPASGPSWAQRQRAAVESASPAPWAAVRDALLAVTGDEGPVLARGLAHPPPGAVESAPRASCAAVVAAFTPAYGEDPAAAIAELVSRTRPSGACAVAVWRRSGAPGRLLALAHELDPPPRRTASPLAWSREELLRPLLEPLGAEVGFTPHPMTLRFDDRATALATLTAALPPLAAVGDQDALRARAAQLVPEPAAIDAPFLIAHLRAR